MIKHVFEYLCSLDGSFFKVIADLEHAKETLSNKSGMVLVEPSRTIIAQMQVGPRASTTAIAALPDRDIGPYLQSNPDVVWALKAQMYENALTVNEVRLYLWTKSQTVSDSLASITDCLRSGSFISSLTLIRSCLEHIADAAVVVEESKKLREPFSDLTARQNAV
jgi:hypothetical protein